jgi:ATP-dependent helicase/nuclease subunit B
LKLRVKQPLEDTQLAFYAALLPYELGASVQAGYLGLDSSKGIELIEHKNVARTAQVLLLNLANDVERLRNGAAMPALGEGQTCEYCEMRGLCRRDHWAAGEFE